MSSHLSVSYASNAGATVTKAMSGGAPDDATGGPSGLLGLFASLLGGDAPAVTPDATGTTTNTATATQTSQANVDLNLADLIRIKLDAGSGDADPEADADAAATDPAPAVDPSTVVVPQVLATLPAPAQQPVADLIASLSELNAALAKGQAPSADLIDKLNQQLDAVGKALGIGDAAQPSFQSLVAQAGATLPADATADQQLTQKLAALSLALTPGTAPADQVAQVPPAQSTVADKLAALAKALGDGAIPADTLKTLGLDTSAPTTDPALKAAITALVNQAQPNAAAAPAQPALATPQLDVAATALATDKTADTKPLETATGKSEPAAGPATPTLSNAAVKPADAKGDSKSSDKGKDKAADAVVVAAAVSPKADAKDTTPANTGQQLGVHAAARVELAAAPARPAAVYQTSQQQINVPQIAFELARQVQHGNSKFQIRLDPPELGRIDVQLDIDNTTGVVNARMMVEKSETLDLMQRDQRSLQQALQQAGLDGSKTNLEFSLRQNNSGQQQQNQFGGTLPRFGGEAAAEEPAVPTVNLYRGSLSASGVNIIA